MPKGELIIPDFTKEDFDGEEPLAWLYSHVDQPYIMARLAEKMKALAKSLGVTGFGAIFQKYCAMMRENEGLIIHRQTEFEDQPMELDSGVYLCTDDGVQVKDRYGFTVTVCKQPIMPVERLVNVDTGEERIRLWYKTGRRSKNIVVEKSAMASSSQILQFADQGVLVNAENAKLLSAYLQDIEWQNYDVIPERRSASRLGWIQNDGFSPYVEGLTFDGESSFKHVFGSVTQAGDYEVWKDAMRKVRAEKGIGRLGLAASFASVILEPCGLLPFFFHVFGQSGYGKTVLLMIAASVWANPKLGEYITTFDSTGVGQEQLCGFLNSLPLCMDELQIQTSSGQKDFDKIVYKLTEGIGRLRGAKSGGLQKVLTWKNCIITSGERPLSNDNSGGGAVNRIIEVEVRDKIYEDLVWLVNVLSDNYGFAGKEFVELLHDDGVIEEVDAKQKEAYRQLLEIDTTEKQAASASAMIAADWLASNMIFQDGNELTVDEISSWLTRKDDVDANKRAYEYINELVLRNAIHFRPNDFGTYASEIWGRDDQDIVYIISSVFEREMQSAGYNARTFLGWARDRGLIEIDNKDKRLTKRVRLNGSLVRCVCLRKTQQLEV